MKKLLLLAAGAVMGLTASAQWAVVGSYCDWSFQTATVLEGDGDDLTCTIDQLTTGFKIVDITDNNWNVQYGTETPVEVGKSYVLDGKEGETDPHDISFANGVFAVNDAIVSWNPTSATLTIQGTPVEQEVDNSVLYLVGNPNDWNINSSDYVLHAVSDGVYEGTFNIAAGDGIFFRFYTALGNWGNDGELPSVGPTPNDNTNEEIEFTDGVFNGSCEPGKGSWTLVSWAGGYLTMVVDLNNWTVTFTEGEAGDVEPGPGPVDTWSVYYENTENWETVYVWAWANDADNTNFTGGTWPGEPMTYDEATGLWSFVGEGAPDMIIFNDGGNGAQTADLEFVNGATYNFEGLAGVQSIHVDLNAPAVYYNLQGVRVNNPEKGVYIVKQGNKTFKVVK